MYCLGASSLFLALPFRKDSLSVSECKVMNKVLIGTDCTDEKQKRRCKMMWNVA